MKLTQAQIDELNPYTQEVSKVVQETRSSNRFAFLKNEAVPPGYEVVGYIHPVTNEDGKIEYDFREC